MSAESVGRTPGSTPSLRRRRARSKSPPPADGLRRVVIERVQPEIDAGRFAVKRTAGDAVEVTAHVHADGHDVLAAVLRYRRGSEGGARPWAETPMEPLGNDGWRAAFPRGRRGTLRVHDRGLGGSLPVVAPRGGRQGSGRAGRVYRAHGRRRARDQGRRTDARGATPRRRAIASSWKKRPECWAATPTRRPASTRLSTVVCSA